MTPADAQADSSAWRASKPNRLNVWQEHRYAYDTWGNCIEKKSGAHTIRHMQWDAEHQLSRVTVIRQQGRFTHTEHWGYDYDPFGRRIAKYRLDPDNEKRNRPWLDDQTTHYTWDGNRLLLERQGDKQQLYVYEHNSFVPLALVRSDASNDSEAEQPEGLPAEYQALKELHPEEWKATLNKMPRKLAAAIRQLDQPAKANKNPVEILYYHTDHLGTPRELTDSQGHITWAATYKAWGNTAKIETPPRLVTSTDGNTLTQRWEQQDDPIEQNLRFQGQYFDAETGLHYNRFRYYDPDCGRFVSQDPIGLLGGVNNYQYAPNPVGWVDPNGLSRIFSRCRFSAPSGKEHSVYQQAIGWDLPVNTRGGIKTNLELAAAGRSPFVIKDGKYSQINLHHSKQDANGSLFELSASAHERYRQSNALHPHLPGAHPYNPVDRDSFNVDRDEYWRQRASREQTRRAFGCTCPC